ncbi:glycosyltransferase family 2 protein [Pyramidobacter piscolens]|uniref:glycosyltransferase family 2 protein n=1 Tax=Pyramidobacter piscolens TaxID=638849 RepID=UPI0026E0B82A|nr:glycosyltransferase family A protein [Pyramidobacter piscolens]
MNPALCSIIIPASKAERTISLALDSLIAQTCPDWRAYVIVDGPEGNDATLKIANGYAARDPRFEVLCNRRNLGAADSRNRGARTARTPWIAFLDSDDVFHPDKLERQLALAEQKDASFLCSAYNMISYPARTLCKVSRVPPRIARGDLIKWNSIGCSTVMLRSELARKYPMDARAIHEDYLCWLQCLQECDCFACQESLTDTLILPGSRNHSKLRAVRGVWEIYRQHLGLSALRSIEYMCGYAIRGFLKYI